MDLIELKLKEIDQNVAELSDILYHLQIIKSNKNNPIKDIDKYIKSVKNKIVKWKKESSDIYDNMIDEAEHISEVYRMIED